MDIDKLFLSGLNYKTEGVENIHGYVEQRLVKESELTEEHRLQNKIIDMYLALLIDKKDNGGPRNVQILHRSIDNDTDLAKSVLKDIEGSGKSKTETPYSFYSLARQTASKNDYITGKVGIGPFALNNNNQILTMIYHISFRESQSSLLSTLGLSRLDKQLDVDGNSIMSWISAMINAHVDIAKDPWISRLNVNPFSYNITNLLLRTGWGGNTFYFLTQPIMKQMADAYVKASSQYMQQNGSTYSRQQQSIKDVAEQYFGKDVTFDGNTLDDALSLIDAGDKESIQAINEAIKKLLESEQFKQDARDYAQGNDVADQKGLKSRQLGIYLAYVQFSKYANALANLVKYCKIDTKKHGKSAVEQLVYKEGFDELFEFATDEDGVLIKKGDVGALFEPAGLLDLVEHSYVGTKTRNAISLTKVILGGQFMSSTTGFIQMLRQLNTMAGNTSLSVSFVQSAQKALSAAIKSQFFNDYASRISDNPRYMHDLVNSSSEDLEFSYDASTNSMSITGNKHSLKSYVGQPILLWYKDKDGDLQQYIPRDKNGNALPLKVLTAKDDKIQLNISINGNFNGVCRLLGGANTIFDRLSRLKPMIYHNSDYSDLQGNLLLEMLIPGKRVEYSPKDAVLGERPDTYDDLKFVKLQNFVDDGGINTNYIINAWNELLEYQNDKQPQVAEYIRDFARDLIVYAFITSGDTQGFTKMFKYVPASWRKKSGYADFVNRKLVQLNSIPTVDLNDVLLNNWYDNKLVPTYQFYSKDANGKRSSNFIGVAKMNSVNGNKQTLSAYPTILAALKKNDEGMYEPSIAVESSPKFIKIPRSYNHYDSQRQYNVYQLYGFARHDSGIMYPVYVLVQPKGTKVSGGFMVTEYGRDDSTPSSTEYVVNQGALRAFVESADFINQLPAIKKNFGDEYATILNDLRTEQTGGVAAAITDDDQAQPINTGNQPSTANKTQQQTQLNDKPSTTQPQTSTPTSTDSSEKSVTEQLVQHLKDSGFTVDGIDKNDIEKNEDYQFAIEQPNAITTADNTSGTNSDVMSISRSRLINTIASTHRQLKQTPKKVNDTRYGADNIYYQLRKALPEEIARDIIKFYNEEKDRESFLDRVEFYINNELKQSVLPKAIAAAKNRQLGFSTRYDARNITAQLFEALKSGKITGNVETDTAAIGRYQTQMAKKLFPAIYYKGWSKQRYGYYAKSFSDISKKIQIMVRLYNNARMGNINHIYKLEAVLEGLKNYKFKQHLIEYITAVDRTTQRNNPNTKRYRVRDKVFKLSPLVLTFKDKQKRSLKEVLSDIKQRTSVYDDIIDTILSKMRGDTTIQLNSYNSPLSVLGSTISYPHKPSISIVLLTTTNKDEFELINTIIHETIHVITLQYLHDNPRTAALLDEYAKYLRFKEGLEEVGWYGNKNAKEMIAEFFSNAEYREWLKTVPAQKLKMSMFDKIVDFIARIFTGKSKTAYEQLKPTFDYILDEALSSTTVSEFTDFFDKLIQSSDKEYHNLVEPISTETDDYEQRLQTILDESPRDSKGRLLAPNGKPSNLPERLYTQVRTKEFKDWFGDWQNDPKNASKVVDENGEPRVVYHGSKSIFNVFNSSESESKQWLSKQIKPTNFFSSDETVADFFAITENQTLAARISKTIDIILDAFAGEDVDEHVLDDEIWTEAAKNTGKSKEFVKDFWENKVPSEYKKNDEFGTSKMEDPNIDKYKYNVFLNMKNPIILDAKGERADRFIKANKEVLNNNDEVIIINIDETVGNKDTATDYLVRNPNQIKSAGGENTTFSKTNNNIHFFKDSKGVVYGYVDDAGIIHLDKNKISPEHPIHEYTHIWDRVVALENPSLWIRGVELMKQFNGGKLWNEIANSEFYGKKWSNISDAQREFMIASEVHARLVGESGAKLISEIEAKQGSSDIISKLKDWILKFWQSLKQTFSNWSYADIEALTLKDFNHMTLRDFVTSNADVAYNESDAHLPLWNKLHMTGFVEHDNDIELSDDVQRAIDKIKAISPNEEQYITPVIIGETFITGVSLIDAINIAAKIFNADGFLEVSDKVVREKISRILYSYDREALFNLLSFGTVPNSILLMLADYMNYDDPRGLVAHYIGFELQKRCQKKSYDDVAIPIIKSIDVKYDDSRQQSLFNDDIMKHCKGN